MARNKFKAFLDTNVLLDVLCTPKRPSADSSRFILQAVLSGHLEGVITTQSILDAAYILSKVSSPFDREGFGKCVLYLMNFLYIDSIHIFDIREAILSPGADLEDDAQFAHALSEGCDAIITSDRGFRHRKENSGILFFTPDEFVKRLRS